MSQFWLKSTLAVSCLISISSAFAQSTTTSTAPSNVSVAESAGKSEESAKLPIGVNSLNFIYGPRVVEPGTPYVVDDTLLDDGQTLLRAGISIRSQNSFRYSLTDKINIAPVLDFDYQLSDPNTDKAGLRSFRWRDCFVNISHGDVALGDIGIANISMGGHFRIYVPTSDNSQFNGNRGGLRFGIAPTIQFGKSAFSLSNASYVRYWIQTQDTNASGAGLPLVEMYTGPQINYQANDSVNVFVLYEASNLLRTQGGWKADEAAAIDTDVEPGVDIQIGKRVTLTPYLNWYPRLPLHSTTMNLAASLTLL